MVTKIQNSTFLFVYGSLKHGYHNHFLLENSKFITTGLTYPKFDMVSFDLFPAVIPQGKFRISGEIYQISRKTLAEIDVIEGHPIFYRREMTAICINKNEHKSCWIYVLQSSDCYIEKIAENDEGIKLWK